MTKKAKREIGENGALPPVLSASGIRDNYRRGTVADFLRAMIAPESHLSVVSAYFTIYAFDALKEHLARITHMDFLFDERQELLEFPPPF